MINKGQVLTHYYRIMNKNGGNTWIQTCATVVCNSKNADEQNIICVNYVVSNRENVNLILDCIQLENGLEHLIKHENPTTDGGAGSPDNDPSNDGTPGSARSGEHSHKMPKNETPDTGTRRNRSTTNTTNTTLATDSAIMPVVGEEHVPQAAPSTGRKAHKRKAKQHADDSDMIADPKALTVAMNLPATDSVAADHGESSVKDLENAMSKHLPSPISNNNNTNANANQATTDFSADSLLKQHQDKSSTIQWIGAHHNAFHQQAAPMPATALLRQLYANRESVIRATARQPAGVFYSGTTSFDSHALASILIPNTIQWFTDGSSSGPLPTPPGSESSFDNQFLLHGHPQKTDPFTNLVSTYGAYPSSIDYHNAMTPPSSVSPREPSASSAAAAAAAAAASNSKTLTNLHSASNSYEFSESFRNQYSNASVSNATSANEVLPSLPLKPQPYSAAAAMHHEAYGSIDQSQYFSHHPGFHLYHKSTPSSGWYSTPS